MIEINLQKIEKKRVWVKDPTKKGGGYWSRREVSSKDTWKKWQDFYKDRTRDKSQTYVDKIVLKEANSITHARALIRKFQRKNPSARVDLAEDFERLYRRTEFKL